MNFFDGTTNLGSIGLSSGMASFGDFSLFAGTHTFTAVYNGDTNDSTSTSSAVTQTITPLPTTITVTPAANPGTFGQVIGFTVAVSPSAAPGVVMLYDGNTQIGATAALTNGTGVINVGSSGSGVALDHGEVNPWGHQLRGQHLAGGHRANQRGQHHHHAHFIGESFRIRSARNPYRNGNARGRDGHCDVP